MDNNLNLLKQKYNEGYRCIYKDKSKGATFHLKDFKREKICQISSNNRMEIGEMESFLEGLDKIQNQTGHDCICTGCANDKD